MNESDMVRYFSVGYDTGSDFRMSDLNVVTHINVAYEDVLFWMRI